MSPFIFAPYSTLHKLLLGTIVILSGMLLCSCKEEGDIIFHDSFEHYEVGLPPTGPWGKAGQGLIVIDSSKSHSGNHSVYLSSAEGFDQRAFLQLTGNPLFPFAYNRISGSYYLWLEEASPDGIHWTMIEASGQVKDEVYKSMIRYGGQHQQGLMANYDTDPISTDCWQHTAQTLPENEWVKIGWQFDGMNNSAKFWINDQLIEDIVIAGSGQGCLGNDLGDQWVFPVFEELLIGWVDYQTGGGRRRLWIDDVMLYH